MYIDDSNMTTFIGYINNTMIKLLIFLIHICVLSILCI